VQLIQYSLGGINPTPIIHFIFRRGGEEGEKGKGGRKEGDGIFSFDIPLYNFSIFPLTKRGGKKKKKGRERKEKGWFFLIKKREQGKKGEPRILSSASLPLGS